MCIGLGYQIWDFLQAIDPVCKVFDLIGRQQVLISWNWPAIRQERARMKDEAEG